MKYTVRRSFIEVVGTIWMPAIRAGTELTLNQYDVENCRDNSGKITRESVQAWLDTHAGDFQCIEDFHASIEDGDETIDIPWETEEGEMTYCDANGCQRGQFH